jgi:hypothetical protein
MLGRKSLLSELVSGWWRNLIVRKRSAAGPPFHKRKETDG